MKRFSTILCIFILYFIKASACDMYPLLTKHTAVDSVVVSKAKDSIENTLVSDTSYELGEENKFIPNPQKAILWSIIPGGGQIYNRKYWKLPIVLGAFTTCAYAILFNQQKYTEYHEAYRDMSSEDPSKNTAWLAFTPIGTTPEDYNNYKYLLSNFQRGDEYFHRWRDISIVSTIAVYALSLLDAYVDAELATFDISPNLSMTVYPQINQYAYSPTYSLSVGCTIKF